ncbi:uncharacterized protein [Ambystoma mexicanum]|uniref:uncharacterized protein isoform X5 n=1 Tax=Ambystoma mexicanum TaxID=8296 RepID=UPI0037E853B3
MATAADTSSMATHDAITKPAKQTPAGPCAYLLPRLACHSPPALNGGGVGCEVKPGEEGRRKRPALLFAALLRAHIKAAPKSAVCLRFGDVDSKSTLFALPEGIKMAAAADSSSMATHDATTKPAKQTPAGPCAYSLRQLAFHSPPALNGGGVGREAKPGEEGHRKKAGRCSSTHYNQALAELPTASQARPSLRLYHSPEKTQHVPRKLTPETDLHHLDADACLVPTILAELRDRSQRRRHAAVWSVRYIHWLLQAAWGDTDADFTRNGWDSSTTDAVALFAPDSLEEWLNGQWNPVRAVLARTEWCEMAHRLWTWDFVRRDRQSHLAKDHGWCQA